MTRVRSESPAATALKVRVQRLPCPLTPEALGGRSVEMATRPFRRRGGRGGELAVAAEEVAGVDVDELEDGWVELHLKRHGEDVASVAEHDGDLEGAADSLVGAGGTTVKLTGDRQPWLGCGRGLV